ncbi:MAG TPA: ferritin-like domain-containing protein [Stellaceae bacterium]|nr:ferritin-like domain-containing protein [Stellaceae bacterium]
MRAENERSEGAPVRDAQRSDWETAPPAPRREGSRARWSLADIPFDHIDRVALGDDRRLMELVTAASFIEISSDTYTQNLAEYYRDDTEVVAWLEGGWQRDELQHGAALRRYVETAWPDFDWDRAYRNFFAEYEQYCTVAHLAPGRALEMAARCVVETGTASFYRMLSDAAPEPVLRLLAAHISADEVNHYKHFFRYFQRYAATEQPGRTAVLRTLLKRMTEVDSEDASCAFKHVRLVTDPAAPFRKGDYDAFRHDIRVMAQRYYRYDMAVKMLVKPLALGATASRIVVPSATALTRLFLFH